MMVHIARKHTEVVAVITAFCLILGIFTISLAEATNSDLIRMLNNENKERRCSAAQQLGERKAKEAVKPLIERLNVEKEYSVRIVIAQALHIIGDPLAIPALKKVAKSDTNRTVRHMAKVIATDMEKYASTR